MRPSTGTASAGRSAGKDSGADAGVSMQGGRSLTHRRRPLPSRTTSVSVNAYELIEGAGLRHGTALMRQSAISTVAPIGSAAISVISPPHFFQGIRRRSRARSTLMPLLISEGQANRDRIGRRNRRHRNLHARARITPLAGLFHRMRSGRWATFRCAISDDHHARVLRVTVPMPPP